MTRRQKNNPRWKKDVQKVKSSMSPTKSSMSPIHLWWKKSPPGGQKGTKNREKEEKSESIFQTISGPRFYWFLGGLGSRKWSKNNWFLRNYRKRWFSENHWISLGKWRFLGVLGGGAPRDFAENELKLPLSMGRKIIEFP